VALVALVPGVATEPINSDLPRRIGGNLWSIFSRSLSAMFELDLSI
jgi:hypothetical protein